MSTSRILVSSGTEFESTVGYSRAVRIGPHVAVAGTTGPGTTDDIGDQTREALRRIDIALNEAGASLSDVIRTRIYVTDISRWREVAVVHADDDNFYAVRDECSHAAVALSEGEVDGCTLECWLHGSRFDLRSGKPTGLPATVPVPIYETKIEDDQVLVRLES